MRRLFCTVSMWKKLAFKIHHSRCCESQSVDCWKLSRCELLLFCAGVWRITTLDTCSCPRVSASDKTVPALCRCERKWQLKLIVLGAVKDSQWTADVLSFGSCSGLVKAKQESSGDCGAAFYYSVLESPWLEFTTESCLQFQYRRYTPTALDVFLALHNGSVLTILGRNNNTRNSVLSTYTWTVPPGVGKVRFRFTCFDSVMDWLSHNYSLLYSHFISCLCNYCWQKLTANKQRRTAKK